MYHSKYQCWLDDTFIKLKCSSYTESKQSKFTMPPLFICFISELMVHLYMHTYQHTNKQKGNQAHIPKSNILTYISTYRYTNMHTHIHTYRYTSINTNIQIYIQVYKHACCKLVKTWQSQLGKNLVTWMILENENT